MFKVKILNLIKAVHEFFKQMKTPMDFGLIRLNFSEDQFWLRVLDLDNPKPS